MPASNNKRRQGFIVTLLAMAVGLSACGYKAPLYIPTPEQKQKMLEREQRIEARKKAAAQKRQAETPAQPSSGQDPATQSAQPAQDSGY